MNRVDHENEIAEQFCNTPAYVFARKQNFHDGDRNVTHYYYIPKSQLSRQELKQILSTSLLVFFDEFVLKHGGSYVSVELIQKIKDVEVYDVFTTNLIGYHHILFN